MHHFVIKALTFALAGGLLSTPLSPTPAAKTTFTIGIQSDVDSTNPFTGIVVEAYETYALMYDYLTTSSAKDVSPQPSLAESYSEAPDKKSWTYKIRAGVKWSDGQPLTARDAAYTFNRIIDGDFEQTNYGNYVANIDRAEATDDTTLVLHVKQPTPIMERLAVPILPEHVWKDVDGDAVKSYANEPQNGQPVVGSGPFQLVERRKGQYLRFAANKNYWQGAPKFDELVFRVFTNADAEAQALVRGEIDFAYDLQSNVFNSLKDKPGVTTRSSEYSGFNEIAFNTGAALADGTPIGDGHEALKNKQVRLAISHAIDRQTLVDRVLNGHGSPGDTFIPPVYPLLHYTPAAPQNFDLAKANQLLDAAGYPKKADGTRFKLRLFARQESQDSQSTAEFVKSWLKEIGIDVTVKVMSEDTLTEVIGQGDYDMFEWGWVVEPDPDYQMSVFTCGKRSYKDGDAIYADLSDSFYCNPAYDELYEQQAGETDQARRAELAKRMQQLVYDDAAYAITYYYNDLVAYRSDRWTGFTPQPDPDGSLLFQYGVHSYLTIAPTTATGQPQAASSSGVNGGLIGGIVAGVVVLAGAAFLVTRRRSSAAADDRE
ncbi:ABC transporter substrate-binding protein [Herbidospora cretacea]|uniref:ABC transporter substrate-binding protein n=1 Tax=Herbidospora cretacea TaxID=28444 RepID=UPI0006892DD0|nr:ABC transporter substrate-binding protein [Herbidospora cretacea]